jgi:hypothetical protein
MRRGDAHVPTPVERTQRVGHGEGTRWGQLPAWAHATRVTPESRAWAWAHAAPPPCLPAWAAAMLMWCGRATRSVAGVWRWCGGAGRVGAGWGRGP